MTFPPDPNAPKGEPRVISDTEGEEITPDNPEVIQNFPVDDDDTVSTDTTEDSDES